jgi:hypothetical protein
MGGFKQLKTAKLGIVLQLTEMTAGNADQRLWEVHDVERNRGFRVSLASRTLTESKHSWAIADIEGAIGVAVERFLTGSSELVAGPMYEVQVTGHDLHEYTNLKA